MKKGDNYLDNYREIKDELVRFEAMPPVNKEAT